MHFGTHLREAFRDWLDEGCLPLVRVEVNDELQTWTAEQLLQKMLSCTDVLPRSVYDEVELPDGVPQTYGAVARVLLDERKATNV